MRLIVAPDPLVDINKPTIFLAGGFMRRKEWRDKIVKLLSSSDEGILLSPKTIEEISDNPDFTNIRSAWEFDGLTHASIFSIWFCDNDSDQPVSLYELGRNVTLREATPERIIIGTDANYSRKDEVFTQMSLINQQLAHRISHDLVKHAANIVEAVRAVNSMPPQHPGGNGVWSW